MILLGVTAAAVDEPGMQNIIFGFSLAAGGVVFTSAAQCFHALLTYARHQHTTGDNALVRRAQVVGVLHCCAFFSGWVLFPIGYSLGPLFGKRISESAETTIFVCGDLVRLNSKPP